MNLIMIIIGTLDRVHLLLALPRILGICTNIATLSHYLLLVDLMIQFLIDSRRQILSLNILISFFFAYFPRVVIAGVAIGLVLQVGG